MKLARFFKKLWTDTCGEKEEMKDFAKSAWSQIKAYFVIFFGIYMLGFCVKALGLHKYVPKTPSGEDAGEFVYGAIAFMVMLLVLGIIGVAYAVYVKIKKTWNEV